MTEKLPSVVIVGRPNVGKSTIFNRLTASRRSIVTDEPGITRDRIYGTATWQGRSFEVVDTGGIVPDDKAAIPREILRQAQVAIEGAAQLLLVVDVRAGLTPLDSELARLLRRTGKPLAIVANKVDTQMQESLAAPFYGLSNDVFPVSAEHGYGFDNMLDAMTSRIGVPEAEQQGVAAAPETETGPKQINVAIIGRPNVGKSTMLNRLVGRRAGHRFGYSGDHARCRGHGGGARRADLPLRGYGRNPPQGQDEPGRRKIERDDGAAAPGTGRRCAADRGCQPRRDRERREHRGICGGVRPLRDHRDEQVGPGAGSRGGKSRARTRASGSQAARGAGAQTETHFGGAQESGDGQSGSRAAHRGL